MMSDGHSVDTAKARALGYASYADLEERGVDLELSGMESAPSKQQKEEKTASKK